MYAIRSYYEIQQLGASSRVEDDVGRLDVAVDDALFGRVLQRASDARGDVQDVAKARRRRLQVAVEIDVV